MPSALSWRSPPPGTSLPMPALLTSASIRGSAASTSSARRSTSASEDRSARYARASPPISASVSAIRSSLRPCTSTVSPACASAAARARPNPSVAPVTRTTMRDDDRMDVQRSDVTVLLATEHAVARVLVQAGDEVEAYPALLAAMGESLAWDFGAVWLPDGDALRCAATWPDDSEFAAESRALRLAPGEGLPGRVWAASNPAWITGVPIEAGFPRKEAAARLGLNSAFAFPMRGAA